MPARCDCHDLLPADCARTVAAVARERDQETWLRLHEARLLGKPGIVRSHYRGRCAYCGDTFPEGTPIRAHDDSWVAACCLLDDGSIKA